jgi:hypothetical protein
MTALALLALVGVAVSLAFNTRLQKAYVSEAEAREKAETAEGEALQREKELGEARLGLERSLGETRKAQGETQKALNLAHLFAYFHRVALADVALRDANVEGARRLLEECPKEQRGWEWGYLRQQCEAPLKVITTETLERWSAMELSPDGRLAAVSDQLSGTVAAWDVEAGKRLWSARPHPLSPSARTARRWPRGGTTAR